MLSLVVFACDAMHPMEDLDRWIFSIFISFPIEKVHILSTFLSLVRISIEFYIAFLWLPRLIFIRYRQVESWNWPWGYLMAFGRNQKDEKERSHAAAVERFGWQTTTHGTVAFTWPSFKEAEFLSISQQSFPAFFSRFSRFWIGEFDLFGWHHFDPGEHMEPIKHWWLLWTYNVSHVYAMAKIVPTDKNPIKSDN